MNPQQQLALLIPLALVAPLLPTIGEPFLWFEAYFREASKALIVFLVGGTPLEYHVQFNGRAATTFRGANQAFILFSGYIGTVLWSLALFLVPSRTWPWSAGFAALSIIVFISLSWPLWGVGGETLAIALMIDAIVIGTLYFRHLGVVTTIGKFLALLLCLSGPRLSLMNILTDQEGLVDTIAAAFQISPFAPVAIWTGLSTMAIAVMFALDAAATRKMARRT